MILKTAFSMDSFRRVSLPCPLATHTAPGSPSRLLGNARQRTGTCYASPHDQEGGKLRPCYTFEKIEIIFLHENCT